MHRVNVDDKIHNKYYIGRSIPYKHYDFFHYSITLSSFLITKPSSPREIYDIIQLFIAEDGVYRAIKKTFWLRTFQRKWKRLFAERKKKILWLMNPSNQFYFSIRGRYPLKVSDRIT
jgi:hypothetical protein